VGGIRGNRARDIGEWESGDNGHVFVGIDLHKSTFNAAAVDDDGFLRETAGSASRTRGDDIICTNLYKYNSMIY
jgi:hypothetical protein